MSIIPENYTMRIHTKYYLIHHLFYIQPSGGSFAYGLGAPGARNWEGMYTHILYMTIIIVHLKVC